ncbi:SigE family RNA polymerase sigma factor [Actinokineospora sp. NBRC 105648]|uniref:SigE family RNA polymerase sigma factor n=1 Tax=Actinokineospora sp. NBRC 105648 TaxID=3032206 RepID=UPI0024A13042|nr:SigE family RNA polymerase sigma factor [Actinokineospora sp. NBRC 105648]GLZ41252.1 DNA-directed RNA polymerase sigma-70 factor [Actinokineospora sp. NBRC 105648]
MARARDTEFAEFFSARFDTYRRIAHALCGDWAEAEEIAQESFVKVYARWSKIRRETADAYLRTVVTRAFLDTRRRGRAREHSVPEVPDTAVDGESDVPEQQVLRAALLGVPPGQRAVLVLRFVADLSVDDVASALGCSPGTVKSQTARGLVALRAAYPASARSV